ncbi:MAG: thioredoxin [Thermoplasmata archaeon]
MAHSKNVVEVKDSNFDEFTKSGVVLLDCWADWCPPCRMIAPVIDEIADEFAGKAKIGKLDVDRNEKVPRDFGIQAIPTLMIFKDGKMVERMVGAQPKARIVEQLKKHLA